MNINATLIGQMITFFILVGVTYRFIWPPILNALEEREATISQGLKAAEQGERQLKQAEQAYQAQLRNGKEAAAELVAKAKQHAAHIVDEAKKQATQEQQRWRQSMEKEVARCKQEAKTALIAEVGQWVLPCVEAVLEQEINPAHHRALIQNMVEALQSNKDVV